MELRFRFSSRESGAHTHERDVHRDNPVSTGSNKG